MGNVADVLDRAAELIEERGWTQGDFQSRGGYCILGAILTIMRKNLSWCGTPTCDASEPLADAIGIPTCALPAWNDAPGRTAKEVVTALRKAASLAREPGEDTPPAQVAGEGSDGL